MPAAKRLKFPPISQPKDWIGHSAHGVDWVCGCLIVLRFKKLLTMETGHRAKEEANAIGWVFTRFSALEKRNRLAIKHLTFLLTLIAVVSCSDKATYYSAKAVVIDTKHRHWGKGYYVLEVYYQYFNGNDTIIGHTTADGKERSYTAKYIQGDSLIISFNPNDSTDTFISEKIYAKPRQGK